MLDHIFCTRQVNEMKHNSSIKRRHTPPVTQAPPGSNRLTICLLLCALTLACKFYYPQGITALQDLLLGAEGSRIQGAVQALSEALEDGDGLPGAAEAFWQGMQTDAPA